MNVNFNKIEKELYESLSPLIINTDPDFRIDDYLTGYEYENILREVSYVFTDYSDIFIKILKQQDKKIKQLEKEIKGLKNKA